MTWQDDYVRYGRRRAGMEHGRYDYSNLFARKPLTWPGGARVALWIVPTVQFYPMNMTPKPFMPIGGMERPQPDYWNYTLRDYGNRIGIFRIFRALAERNLKASVAVNSRAAERYPAIMREIKRNAWEVLGHGVDMGKLHYDGLPSAEEEHLISTSLASLRRITGQAVTGWLSPVQAESFDTPDLLVKHGIDYVCDWGNDDLPYRLATKTGTLHAMPQALEIADTRLFHTYKHRNEDVVEELLDHFRLLYREAEKHGGRIVSLSLTPWLIGVPHRIGVLEQALDSMLRHEGVWPATSGEILAAVKQQQ